LLRIARCRIVNAFGLSLPLELRNLLLRLDKLGVVTLPLPALGEPFGLLGGLLAVDRGAVARVTADALDALGRTEEAKALREQYGVTSSDEPKPS
jgi:hypothetical protein